MFSAARSTTRSESLFAEAQKLMPGGVSSPVRAFKAVGGTPLFIKEAEGCKIVDVDGNSYIDYVMSYGPLVAGHANERVVAALSKAIGKGTSYGAPCEGEVNLASIITKAMPAVEMVRFVNSGTEAAMSALRLARAATGRELIIKCIGCYHGHVDAMLVSAGSGALTLGTPSSPGVPKDIASTTILVHYNDLHSARAAMEKYRGQIACFAVEPVAGNMGLIPPAEGYLEGLRKLCDEFDVPMLMDEVMTGFRVAWGGAQGRYGVRPDITCLGKIIGGGLPVGAYGASKNLMQRISPAGPVYQAGTLSGNPLAMAGGIATLEILQEPGAYETLETRSAALAAGITAAAEKVGVPMCVNRVGSMVGFFFTHRPGQTITNYAEATAGNTDRFARFFHALLARGIYIAPSMYEAMFVSLAHRKDDIDRTVEAFEEALAEVA